MAWGHERDNREVAPHMGRSRGSGDWLVLEELLERGVPSFVERLRAFHDAEALASFAARWCGDRRPASRRFLLEYLDRPLDAYRHEPLVKRLFKLAEAAGDDEVMARFLVLFDRSLRRQTRRRVHYERRLVRTEPEARALVAAWDGQGLERVSFSDLPRGLSSRGAGTSSIVMPYGTAIPRPGWKSRDPRQAGLIRDNGTRIGRLYRGTLLGQPVPDRSRQKLAGM